MLDHTAFIAGAASGFTVRLLTQPLDVLKIRFQLQLEPISKKSSKSYYISFWQATKRIYTEEGIKGLWKGHLPAQYLSMVFGSVQFSTFDKMNKWYIYQGQKESNNYSNFIFGGISGCIASIFCNPIDVIRTRLASQGKIMVYSGFINATVTMYQQEKLRGFFRGLVPSIVLIFPQTALQFMIYYSSRNSIKSYIDQNQIKVNRSIKQLVDLLCGSCAGIISKFAIYPLDLTKRRLQIQGFESGRRPFGQLHQSSRMIDSLIKTMAKEGHRGLYKGLLPSSIKAAAMSGLTFYFYERYTELIMILRR